MKEIKINSDNTINIVNPDKYYVLQVTFKNGEKRPYILSRTNQIYEFACGGPFPEHTFQNVELQKCITLCLRRTQDAAHAEYWTGTLYQFENEQEFNKAQKAGLI